MADVVLSIGGHNYSVSCADGEEQELARLAAMVDAEVGNVRAALGPLTESRQLLFAALFLADKVGSATGDASNALTHEATDLVRSTADALTVDALSAATARISALNQRLHALTAQIPAAEGLDA